MTIYTIVRNKSNEVIFATNNYDIMKEYVSKHFPFYMFYDENKTVILKSKNYTYNKTIMNYDSITNEEY